MWRSPRSCKKPSSRAIPSQQIATGCNAQGSRFVATGRGGLPPNPNEQVGSDRPWNDIRDVSAFQQQGNPIADSPLPTPGSPIIEATETRRNPNGTIELIATSAETKRSNLSVRATCTEAIAR